MKELNIVTKKITELIKYGQNKVTDLYGSMLKKKKLNV